MVQEEEGGVANIVLTTHEAVEAEVMRALGAIQAQTFALGPARMVRIR